MNPKLLHTARCCALLSFAPHLLWAQMRMDGLSCKFTETGGVIGIRATCCSPKNTVSDGSRLPNISIPLYEIKAGDIVLPVSLSHHASGIKVTDLVFDRTKKREYPTYRHENNDSAAGSPDRQPGKKTGNCFTKSNTISTTANNKTTCLKNWY